MSEQERTQQRGTSSAHRPARKDASRGDFIVNGELFVHWAFNSVQRVRLLFLEILEKFKLGFPKARDCP